MKSELADRLSAIMWLLTGVVPVFRQGPVRINHPSFRREDENEGQQCIRCSEKTPASGVIFTRNADGSISERAVYCLSISTIERRNANYPNSPALSLYVGHSYTLYIKHIAYTMDTPHNNYTDAQTRMSIVSDQKTTIRVAESTKERLKQYGEMGMSYDDALNEVLDRLEHLEDESGRKNER